MKFEEQFRKEKPFSNNFLAWMLVSGILLSFLSMDEPATALTAYLITGGLAAWRLFGTEDN